LGIWISAKSPRHSSSLRSLEILFRAYHQQFKNCTATPKGGQYRCAVAPGRSSFRQHKSDAPNLDFPPIEQHHAGIVERGAEDCVLAMQVAQDVGIGFELGREETAELGQRGGCVDIVGVGGLVIHDPPRFIAFRERIKPGAEDAVHANRGEPSGDDSGPADFAAGIGVGRENPLGLGVVCGFERKLERLGGNLTGQGRIEAGSAHLGSDARFALRKSGAGGIPIQGGAEPRQLFKERMDGGSQHARDNRLEGRSGTLSPFQLSLKQFNGEWKITSERDFK